MPATTPGFYPACRHKKHKQRFILLCLLLPSFLFPAVKIQFEGLTRTSTTALANRLSLKNYENTPFTPDQQQKLVSSIRRLGVFSDVLATTKQEKGDTIVTISVKEKWTLFPFPMFRTSGDSTSYGAFLMEMNVFGILKTMYSGVMFSNDGISFMGGFIDPSLAGSRFTSSIFALYGRDIFEDSDDEENIFRRYKANTLSINIGIGYNFSESFVLSIFTEYKNTSVQSDASEIAPPDSAALFSPGIRIQFNRLSYRGWFPEGLKLRFQASAALSRLAETKSGYKFKLYGQENIALGKRIRWGLSFSGGISSLPDTLQERIGGKPGYMTLPAETLIARDYWSLSTQLEYRALSLSWATLTGIVFAEYGAFARQRGDWTRFYGPGAGIRLYLKKVALPAMGLDIAWNLKNRELFTGFAIGMRM